MKQNKLCFLFLLTLSSIVESFNVFKPTKAQVKTAQKERYKRKPKPQTPASPPPLPSIPSLQLPELPEDLNPLTPSAWTSVTSAALGLATRFVPKSIRENSDRAARVRINRLPPQSIKVDLSDVPIVGPSLTGTYAKVKEDVQKPSVVIASPADKLGAIQDAAKDGKLEFGLDGLLRSSLDIKLQPNKPGMAPVEFKSPLIPKWPFGHETRAQDPASRAATEGRSRSQRDGKNGNTAYLV